MFVHSIGQASVGGMLDVIMDEHTCWLLSSCGF